MFNQSKINIVDNNKQQLIQRTHRANSGGTSVSAGVGTHFSKFDDINAARLNEIPSLSNQWNGV